MLLAELEPADRSLTLLQDALREATGDPSLQAAIHQQLAENGRVHRRNLVGRSNMRAAALELGETLRRRREFASVRCPSSLSSRFNVGDADAPGVAEQAFALAR